MVINRIQKKRRGVLSAAVAFFWAAIAVSVFARAEEQVSPKLAAIVNGSGITLRQLQLAVEDRIPATGHMTLSEKRAAEIRREVLERLIADEILSQEARRLKLTVTPDEMKKGLDKIRGRFPSEEEYQKALRSRGMAPEEIERSVETHLLIQKLVDQEIRSKVAFSDAAMSDYYQKNKEKFMLPEQIRLRLILVKVDPGGSAADWEAGKKKVVEIGDRVHSGEDFAQLAKQLSEDEETKDRGGDTGLLHRGRMPFGELEGPAFELGVGKLSDPVRTLYGWIVFRVEERRPAKQLAFSELNKELLRQELSGSEVDRRLVEKLKELRQRAIIEIY
jgi:peptidyl-prolyl cis-trans isomerase C